MKKAITVKQLTNYIKNEILSDVLLQNLMVEGEIVNLSIKKFTYFSLKEDENTISCVLFDNNLNFKEGDKVVVKGAFNIYSKDSKYQIRVKEVQNIGLGKEIQKFSELKSKLEKLGYFDKKNKKNIPKYPLNIGLITGENSAAFFDFLKVIKDSNYNCNIYLLNTLVQGNNASNDIVEALQNLDNMNLDLIVLTRGGGSNEDLSVFNTEEISREIFQLNTPIISAIGHEIDLSLAELTSDMYFSTPTKLAEYVVSRYNMSKENISNIRISLDKFFTNFFIKKNSELNDIKYRINLNSPIKKIEKDLSDVRLLNNKLISNFDKIINNKLIEVSTINSKIEKLVKLIIRRNSLYLKDINHKSLSLDEVKINNRYIIYNDKVSYTVLIEGKLDG